MQARKSHWLSTIAWCCLSVARRYSCADCLVKIFHHQAPSPKHPHCFTLYRLAVCHSPSGATRPRDALGTPFAWRLRLRQALYQ